MSWADLVRSAGLIPRWLWDGPDTGENSQHTSGEHCPTAQTMSKTPLPDVTQRLERRALIMSNRNKTQARRYLDLHRTLAKGVYFDE